MGTVRTLPTPTAGVRLADAAKVFLGTIPVANTRRGYAVVLDRLVRDFGADGNVALLDPDRVAGWFIFVWGGGAAPTFNVRLASLRSACRYWRDQGWLTADPLVRLRARPAPPDTSKALSRQRVADILGSDAPLRERVPRHLLCESSAGAEEVLMLDVPDLDSTNRCAVVTRKGGARDVNAWQTGTARLLPRMLAGRRTGPVFLTDRRAKPSVALVDVDPTTGRARLSYRRAASASTLAAHTRGRARGVDTDADEAVRPHLGAVAGEVRADFRRRTREVAGRERPLRPPPAGSQMTDHTHHLFVVGGVGVAQWPVGAAEVGQLEGVVAVDADVVADERRQPRNVGVEYRMVLGA